MKRILNCVVRHLVGLEKEGATARTIVCKHNLTLGKVIKIQNSGIYGRHASATSNYIYVYFICKDTGALVLDRSVSRTGLGPSRARELVDAHEKRGHESFYTIGTRITASALN